jgi:hypothetical protein
MFATTLLAIYGVDSCRNYYPDLEEIGQEEDHIMYHTASRRMPQQLVHGIQRGQDLQGIGGKLGAKAGEKSS